MDDSAAQPNAEALIQAVNEAIAAGSDGIGAVMQFLFAWYQWGIAAGFPEQRAFEITLCVLNYYLSNAAALAVMQPPGPPE